MVSENIKATGNLELVLTDALGNIKEKRNEKNLVVTTGKGFIAARMGSAASAIMSHMAIGTSATVESAAQTALITQAGIVALTSTSLITTTVSLDTVQYVATFGAGTGTGAIVEAGLFNAASAGTMLSRTVFSVINKGASDVLTITWKVTIS